LYILVAISIVASALIAANKPAKKDRTHHSCLQARKAFPVGCFHIVVDYGLPFGTTRSYLLLCRER
jgi:hypothetical protein